MCYNIICDITITQRLKVPTLRLTQNIPQVPALCQHVRKGKTMPSNKPQILVRTTEEIKKKIEYIAIENNRSVSKEVELLIKKYVKRYEEDNGVIE